MKILVTTYPFSASTRRLITNKIKFNDLSRKFKPSEIKERLLDYKPEIIIAGTEEYDKETLNLIPNLKMISRVGIGIDSVNLEECKKRGIILSNTPDAPSNAVAELVIGQMLNIARKIQYVDHKIRKKEWIRHVGFDLGLCTVGLIGCGRIGKLVAEKLVGFGSKILVNDIISEKAEECRLFGAEPSTKKEILIQSKIISLHVPLTPDTLNYISDEEFKVLAEDACLINMSRGNIINEEGLYRWLKSNQKASAAIDVFANEPYKGSLLELENCYLTPHMGSCTKRSRHLMESGAVEEVYKFINNLPSKNRIT